MKNLDLVEDEYKMAFEDVVEKYREKLKNSSDHEASRKEFSKNLNKILKRRNEDYLKYVSKNKQELLELPEKKKKKMVKELGVYKAYNLDFKPTFREKFMASWHRFSFKFSLVFRSVKYNIIPSWLKLLFFKIKLFLSSLFFDIGNFRRFTGRRINLFMGRHANRIKDSFMIVVNWIKRKWAVFEEWKKRRIEERKKKEEEAEKKKLKDIEDKKKISESVELNSGDELKSSKPESLESEAGLDEKKESEPKVELEELEVSKGKETNLKKV